METSGEREARLELAGTVLNLKKMAGDDINGAKFDRLMDLPMDNLYLEIIMAQDDLFF